MAKATDKIWFCNEDGDKVPGEVTRGQTFVDGLPAKDSYDAETADIVVHACNDGVNTFVAGGFAKAKQAKTETDKQTPGHFWPRT